ncbi:pentapeptide repeat-containing protein [Micromonospora sagamiensis]|uniref:pentapeptide repeat-containing protein n=1 Tax=Micromonospora sagamiensis TaxID=47875 RepID=UPI001648DDB5|nr:pentapeptide repeat-containing protein [Micromonospora sagamiensis]
MTALTAVAALLFTARSLDYTADATRATRDQIDLSAQGQIADRFNRAIDQLGQTGPDKLSIRLGGIYSLEHIMRDSPGDGHTVIEVLCAFIRTNGLAPTEPADPSKIPAVPEDVLAAVTVLGRRPNPDNSRLDFTGTQLSLPGISLNDANLAYANLAYANLRFAGLVGADLHGVDLRGAHLGGAHLGGADLRGVDLRGAYLGGVDLRDADLGGADLGGTNLVRADLRAADLADVKNLTSAAVRCSWVDDQTRLPPGVTRPAGEAAPEDRASC